MKKIILLLLGVVVFMAVIFPADSLPGEKELLEKAWQLYEQQKYQEAPGLIDKGLTGYGETSYWLIDRKGILRDSGMHPRDKETLKKAIDKWIAQ